MDETVEVPTTLDEVLSPEWLTAALGRRFPGISVRSSKLGPIVARVSTNARFEIEVDGDLPEGLSRYLCAKGYFTDPTSAQAGVPEVGFYRDIALVSGVRTLRSVWADIDPEGKSGVVITEDVVAEGATFLDALSPYTADQAAKSLEQFATLHRNTWDVRDYDNVPFLVPRVEHTLRARGLTEINGNFFGPNGKGVPEAVRDGERLLAAVRTIPAVNEGAKPWCLIHGDAHIGNFFLDADGCPCLLDWQLVQRGPWYMDVGYHIASALPVEDRRANERDLLAHYLDCLGSTGVTVPSWDEAWTAIHIGMVYGFFLWAITLKVDPKIIAALLERLGSAVADHDAMRTIETRV